MVAEHVVGALDELGEVVRRKWGFSAESIDQYKQDLCRRGAVPEMRDEILRVVRDPIRKLSPRERLVAPAMLAVEYGLPRRGSSKASWPALRYRHPQDPQSVALSEQLARAGTCRKCWKTFAASPRDLPWRSKSRKPGKNGRCDLFVVLPGSHVWLGNKVQGNFFIYGAKLFSTLQVL